MHRRRAIAGSALTLLLAGCAGFGGPRHFTLSAADLQARLEREFPRQRRLLEVVDVTLDRPSLRLLPERNRVATQIELSATERLSGRTLRGSLALDHALRFEPTDASVRLSQVHVLAAELDLGDGPLSGSGARLGALLAERLLDDFTIWRADTERLARLQRAGMPAADIIVTARGIEIHFADPR